MKKIFLSMLAFSMFASPSLMAQEEDMTSYIANPGFDEDISMTVDGQPSKTYKTGTSYNSSTPYIADDGSIYAHSKSKQSWNGFNVKVKGWESTNTSTTPEWFYFLSLPYGLNKDVIEVGNDGEKINVVEKPADLQTEDNTGVLYLRAGWGNAATYKQEVDLPCAEYRLEYYIRNTGKTDRTDIQNLCRVICRGTTFVDSLGLTSVEWEKHTIKFTPVSSFTIEFGFKSGNANSNNNPHIWIDGIKLFKIGEADLAQVITAEFVDLQDKINAFMNNGDLSAYTGIVDDANDIAIDITENTDLTDAKAAEAGVAQLKAFYERLQTLPDTINRIMELQDKVYMLLASTNPYPGLAALTNEAENVDRTLNTGTIDQVMALPAELEKAIQTYYFSQAASLDEPADYTFLVQHPWFCNDANVPASASNEDVVAANLADGVKNGGGWTDGSTAGGTRGAWFKLGRTCFQLWGTNFSGYFDVHQELTNIPNGVYSLSADMITNTASLSDQHIYLTSQFGTAEAYMTHAAEVQGWGGGDIPAEIDYPNGTDNPWETVHTTETVIVEDGKLTIGARSTHGDDAVLGQDDSQGGRRGSFWVTNFVLYYHGEAGQAAIEAAAKKLLEDANKLADSIQFAADKVVMKDSIAAYEASKDIVTLNNAIAMGNASTGKYAEIMAEGKTIPTVTAILASEVKTDSAYAAGKELARHAFGQLTQWMTSDVATYKDVDGKLNDAKAVLNNYIPAYILADSLVKATASEAVKNALEPKMQRHTTAILADTLLPSQTIDLMVTSLKNTFAVAEDQNNYETNANGNDYTSFIKNPQAQGQDGWNFQKGNGNGPITKGEHFSGDTNHAYFDSWNGTAGALNFYGDQKIQNLPNGTYTIKVAARSDGDNVYVFAAADTMKLASDTIWVALERTELYPTKTAAEADTMVQASSQFGPIWDEATKLYEADPHNEEAKAIAEAHNLTGFGWKWLTIENVKVTKHELTIGMTVDSLRTGKPFTGTWFSIADWSLTLVEKDADQGGWIGPMTAINAAKIGEEVKTVNADGIYTLNGNRVSAMTGRGLYIVVRGGKARKVLK